MKHINDYELIYLIKRGSNDAYELLISKYTKYIAIKISKYKLYKNLEEEITQECLMLLVLALNKFDSEYNVLFFTYLDKIFTRKIYRYIDSSRRNSEIIEYFIEKEKRDFKEVSFEYSQYDILQLNERVEIFYNHLSNIEIRVYKEIMIGGMQINLFAEKYDLKIKTVYNFIQSVRKKFNRFSSK